MILLGAVLTPRSTPQASGRAVSRYSSRFSETRESVCQTSPRACEVILPFPRPTAFASHPSPAHIAGIYEIDKKIKAASKLKVNTVHVDQLVAKSSKRKNKSSQARATATADSSSSAPLPAAPSQPTTSASASHQQPEQGSQEAQEAQDELVRSGRKIAVKCVTIESRLQMALSDPAIQPLLLFGKGRTDGVVTEFRDTPFARQPDRYSKFTRVGTSFGTLEMYDDFEFAANHRRYVGRACGFLYETDRLQKEVTFRADFTVLFLF